MNFLKSTLTITVTSILALSVVSCGNKDAIESTESTVDANKKNVKQQAEEMSHDVDHAPVTDKTVAETVISAKTEKGIIIENAYATATIPGQRASAAYFIMKNTSDEDIEATAISSNVCDLTEFHTMEMKDSKMYMRTMKKLVVPAGGEVVFSEGANHIMLINLKQALEAGGDAQLYIEFNNNESVDFTLPIKEQDLGDMILHAEHAHESHEKHKHEEHEHEHEGHEGHEEHKHEHKHEDSK